MANEHATETQPAWEDVVAAYAEAAIEKRDGPCLATVQTYDGAHTATVKPLTAVPVRGVFQPAPIFTVNVGWPSDGGPSPSFSATFPLKVGSIVELVAHKFDQTTYTESKAPDQAPASEARFSLSHAVAHPVSAAPAVPLPPNAFAADGYVIFAQPFVYLGGADATDFVALASKVLTELTSVKTWADPHSHAPGTFSNGGGPVVGTSGPPIVPMPAPGSVASAVVKSK
ncbi:MAG: hypothetical protein V3V34_11780 [Kiloniellales bacterium]